MNNLPNRHQAQQLLFQYVTDEYQRYHALMVGTVLAGYARMFGADEHLWFVTGYLHDIDFEQYPDTHPGESIRWFNEWNYPKELIHAVHAHACGYNGYTQEPESQLANALIACDEICGVFYAYKKVNPIPYEKMKPASIVKRIHDTSFAPGINRQGVENYCAKIGITLEEHVVNITRFLSEINT